MAAKATSNAATAPGADKALLIIRVSDVQRSLPYPAATIAS
jgi:hypothetical protein